MTRLLSRSIQVLVFLILVVTIDQVTGFIFRKLYFHQHAGPMHGLNYALNECKADILIFGAPQAQHSYDPRIISDSLKMSCYNAGQDGGHSIILQYAQIKVITKRYTPKVIILDFHPNNVVHYPGDYDRLYILLPYYQDYPDLRPFILLRSPFERVKLLSAVYPFNSTIIDVIRYNTFTHAARVKDINGYIPLKGVMNMGMYKKESGGDSSQIIDTNMVKSLKNIISICNEKKIALYIVSSPIYRTVDDRIMYSTPAEKLSIDIIRNKNVNYFDFSFHPAIKDSIKWFEDQNHLNEIGASIFTQKLVRVLHSNLQSIQFQN
jgi:hypothetical protein